MLSICADKEHKSATQFNSIQFNSTQLNSIHFNAMLAENVSFKSTVYTDTSKTAEKTAIIKMVEILVDSLRFIASEGNNFSYSLLF